MLRFLRIRHLAVIDSLELEFGPGFTVLTGETGAGKSILVGAVGLLVGGRASADLVRTGEEQATVEAIFDQGGDELIVRREISTQGRSRAFVNGDLVTSAVLRETCGGLVDLHGQHEHQLLLDPSAHLDLLDEFGGLSAERAAVADAFSGWTRVRAERDALLAKAREKDARADFLRFQLAEIDRVAPQPSEDEELSATRQVLANADRLQRYCEEAYTALYDSDQSALTALGAVWKRVADLAALDARFAPHLEAREAVKSQLEDLAFFLRSYVNDIDASPARLQEIEERLAALERLKKKHGPSLADVIAMRDRVHDELQALEHATERAADLEAALAAARDRYLGAARVLTNGRTKAAPEFAHRLETALADLAMTRTRCEVRLLAAAGESAWSDRGLESGEFFISPNPGEDLRPLARIASGGELSRIMLALRTLAATDEAGKTLIFDEVDAGIGGAVADVVGKRLQGLGDRFQVLCITHLPQIAAYGAAHFGITKSVKRDRTVTRVARLTGPEREQEMARMIGGADTSGAVIASARQMLETRGAVGKGRNRPSVATGESKRKAKGESESPWQSDT